MISWSDIRDYGSKLSKAEEKLITNCFNQYVAGNDGFDERSRPEISELHGLFRMGWLMHELFVKGDKLY